MSLKLGLVTLVIATLGFSIHNYDTLTVSKVYLEDAWRQVDLPSRLCHNWHVGCSSVLFQPAAAAAPADVDSSKPSRSCQWTETQIICTLKDGSLAIAQRPSQ